jgi:hypothetical protein
VEATDVQMQNRKEIHSKFEQYTTPLLFILRDSLNDAVAPLGRITGPIQFTARVSKAPPEDDQCRSKHVMHQ